MDIQIKRVYEPAAKADGFRVLVDRLWPRGVSKDKAAIDLWLKEVAPSHELRKWFGHAASRWDEFQRRYAAEIEANAEPFERLAGLARDEAVTLLFATREPEHHHAVFLAEKLGEL